MEPFEFDCRRPLRGWQALGSPPFLPEGETGSFDDFLTPPYIG